MDASRLFHAIVTAGIAVGCSSEIVTGPGGSGGSGAAGKGGASVGGAGGTGGTLFAGSGGSTAGCAPSQVHCASYMPVPSGCACDLSAPASPAACASTADFFCMSYTPVPMDCTCHVGAPEAQSDCPCNAFQCEGGYDPPIGCTCVTCILPPP